MEVKISIVSNNYNNVLYGLCLAGENSYAVGSQSGSDSEVEKDHRTSTQTPEPSGVSDSPQHGLRAISQVRTQSPIPVITAAATAGPTVPQRSRGGRGGRGRGRGRRIAANQKNASSV